MKAGCFGCSVVDCPFCGCSCVVSGARVVMSVLRRLDGLLVTSTTGRRDSRFSPGVEPPDVRAPLCVAAGGTRPPGQEGMGHASSGSGERARGGPDDLVRRGDEPEREGGPAGAESQVPELEEGARGDAA